MNGYQYRAVFTNGTAPDATTTAATLAVNPAVTLSPGTLSADTVGVAYAQTITGGGGTGTISLAVSNIQNAISGLVIPLSGTGTLAISGTPAAAGTETFTVTATDSVGGTRVTTYSINVEQPTPMVTTVGLYDSSSSMFMLRDSNDSGFADQCCCYGAANGGMSPIVGDWNGDGIQSIGLYNPTTSTFYLRNTNDGGCADTTFVFGPANSDMEPIAGDWTGEGKDTVGLYDPANSTFYLRNTNDSGFADIVFSYGPTNQAMLPVAGDWDGSGHDGIGLYNRFSSTFYLRETTHLQGPSDKGYADTTLYYGGAPWIQYLPIAGDWNGDGKDGIGLYDRATSTFYLRNAIQLQGSSDKGYADLTFTYGSPYGVLLPLAGDWTGSTVNSGQASTSSAVTGTTGTMLSPAASQLSSASLAILSTPATSTVQNVSGAKLATIAALDSSTSAAGDTSVLSGCTASSGTVSSRAVDQIDLSSVAASELGHFARSSDPDALTGDIVGGIV
jgi:hypothetical protein